MKKSFYALLLFLLIALFSSNYVNTRNVRIVHDLCSIIEVYSHNVLNTVGDVFYNGARRNARSVDGCLEF